MPLSILIVDNDSAQRRYLAAVLRAAGHEPVAVAIGPKAIGRLRDGGRLGDGGIALVLLDLDMPGRGLEVLRRLGRESCGNERQQPPLIVLAAEGSVASAVTATQADDCVMFLAEIAELLPEGQVKLLHAIRMGEVDGLPPRDSICADPAMAEGGTAPERPEEGNPFLRGDGHVKHLSEIEAEAIRRALALYGGRMSETARRLGIGRSTLYRKLGELGIKKPAGRA